jgi:transposase
MEKRRSLSTAERKLIFNWKEEGIEQQEMAKRLKISNSTVTYVLKNYTKENCHAKTHTRGRKKILSGAERGIIMEKIEGDRKLSATKLANFVKKEINKKISPKTLKRYASSNGFQLSRARKVPLISEKCKKIRLEWAKEHIIKPKSFWEKVLYTDETKLNHFSDGCVWRWRRDDEEAYDEKCTIKTVKYNGGKINLWGCMNARGVGNLAKIDGNMDGPKYVEILQDNLGPSIERLGLGNGYILQQDNDPKHRSKLASNFFRENGIELLKWPSYSPDLNVIEHVWAYIKKKYNENPAKSKSEMFEKIQQIWGEIPANFTRKLVDSMYKRLSEVIRMKGGATKY